LLYPRNRTRKKEAEKVIDEINTSLEPVLREEWELNVGIARMGLRNQSGPKPKWKWDSKHGKLVRGAGNGIDWWRYQYCVLLPKLFPFVKECQKDRPDTIVQEDKAPAHAHFAQQRVYDLHEIQRLLWCGNSPDLNAIEPCWFWLKRATTKKGAPKSRAQAIEVWEKQWADLPQEKMQAWIERIIFHVQEVIRLEGGNEYKEGRHHTQRSHD